MTAIATTTPDTPIEETQVTTYTLKRDGDRNVVFDGLLLGEASSQRQDQDRWFEARIFKTVGGTYVVAGVGRSTRLGETDRCWAETCATGAEVIGFLTRTDDDGVEYLTRTARDALTAAADLDDGIRDAFFRRVA